MATLLAQFFLLLGLFCNIVVVADCRFVHVESEHVDPFLASLYNSNNNNTTLAPAPTREFTSLGLYIFEDFNGSCAFRDVYGNGTSYEDYADFTTGWEAPRAFSVFSAYAAILLWTWLLTWSCVAHTRAARRVWVLLVFPTLALLQCATLFVLATDFCKEHACRFARSAGVSVCAMVCYALSAAAVWWGTRDAEPVALSSSSPSNESHDEMVSSSAAATSPTQVVEDGVGDAQEVPIDPSLVRAMLAASGGEGQAVQKERNGGGESSLRTT